MSTNDKWERIILALMSAGAYDGTILPSKTIKDRPIIDLELLSNPEGPFRKICLFIPKPNAELKTYSLVLTKSLDVHLIVGELTKTRYTFSFDYFCEIANVWVIINNLMYFEKGILKSFPYCPDRVHSSFVHQYEIHDSRFIAGRLVNLYNEKRIDYNDVYASMKKMTTPETQSEPLKQSSALVQPKAEPQPPLAVNVSSKEIIGGKVIFIKGFNTEVWHLLQKFSEKGMTVVSKDLDAKVVSEPNTYYYFISNFRNLLTSYEKTYLTNHPFVKDIIALDPDFDEYNDVASDFEKRYPEKKLWIYDERAIGKAALNTYGKDQIDLILAHVSSFISQTISMRDAFVFNDNLKQFSEKAAEVAHADLVRFYKEVANKGMDKIIQKCDEFIVPLSVDSVRADKLMLQKKVDSFLSTCNVLLLKLKIGATLLFLGAFAPLYWLTVGNNRFLYLACASAAFCAFQISLLITDYFLRKANRTVTQTGSQLLRNCQSFMRENKRAIATIEALKKDLHTMRRETDNEVTKYFSESKVKTEIIDKKNNILEAITKKAS
jgi:hypothetical protein